MPMVARAVSVFPDPDSPTSAVVFPFATLRLRSVTASRIPESFSMEMDRSVMDRMLRVGRGCF